MVHKRYKKPRRQDLTFWQFFSSGKPWNKTATCLARRHFVFRPNFLPDRTFSFVSFWPFSNLKFWLFQCDKSRVDVRVPFAPLPKHLDRQLDVVSFAHPHVAHRLTLTLITRLFSVSGSTESLRWVNLNRKKRLEASSQWDTVWGILRRIQLNHKSNCVQQKISLIPWPCQGRF